MLLDDIKIKRLKAQGTMLWIKNTENLFFPFGIKFEFRDKFIPGNS